MWHNNSANREFHSPFIFIGSGFNQLLLTWVFETSLALTLLKKKWNIIKLNKVGSVIHVHFILLNNVHGGLLTHLTNCDNLLSSKMLSIVNIYGLCTPSYVHCVFVVAKKCGWRSFKPIIATLSEMAWKKIGWELPKQRRPNCLVCFESYQPQLTILKNVTIQTWHQVVLLSKDFLPVKCIKRCTFMWSFNFHLGM
jgi:hypothetical protein